MVAVLVRAQLVLLLFCSGGQLLRAETLKPDTLNRKRLWITTGVSVGIYGTALVGLDQLWYAQYDRSSFHFFNDNGEWMQIDKTGHAFTSYYEGVYGIEMMKWTGLPRKQAIWIGGLYGSLLQTPIEILDGFSAKWGASWGDLLANTSGSALVIAQALAWDEQRIQMKFSYHNTFHSKLRPNAFGTLLPEMLLKNYNGQTYWLSVNPSSFMDRKPVWWPAWLNIAVGYGADNMLGAYNNQFVSNGVSYDYGYLPRYRQFYISPDIDLTRIPVRNKNLRFALKLVSFVKIPMPALEVNTRGNARGHWFYF